MKRINNLYTKIITIENLTLADKKAQKGKYKQLEVIKHNKNKEENIRKLHQILTKKEFKTSEYSLFTIKEKKERQISRLPYFPDRIIHHAIMIHLEKIFVASFISQTYNCIKKRGILKGLKRLNKDLHNKEYKYCLKLDVKKFYESIDKEILKKKLRTKFKDVDLLNLLDEIIDSNPKGIPLGNLPSQFFANFYMNSFDHWIKEVKKVQSYVRYCDDICILGDNKLYLHNLSKEIITYLSNNLKLTLSKYQVFPTKCGIDFLGYVSYPTHIKLRKSIKEKMRKTLNNRNKASYYGWLKHCNARNLERKLNIIQ